MFTNDVLFTLLPLCLLSNSVAQDCKQAIMNSTYSKLSLAF